MNKYLSEAFKSLNMLTEAEAFDLQDTDAADKMGEFKKSDDELDIIDVIDPEAETEEDLQDSYIGNVILDCPVCHSKLFKPTEEVILDEAGKLANVGEECPYCLTTKGFTVVGQVAPFAENDEDTDVDVDDEDIDIEDDTATDELLGEGFEKVEVDTDTQHMRMTQDENGKVVVETEPKTAGATLDLSDEILGGEPEGNFEGNEMIAPLDTDTVDDIENNEDKPEISDITEPENVDEIEYDLDDFDEDTFSAIGESYLKRAYNNIKSFKVESVNMPTQESIIVEGKISFKDGKQGLTSFVFESAEATRDNKVLLSGYNKQITRGNKSLRLYGRIEGNKLVSEALNYNYRAKDENGKSRKFYGTVKYPR